jgi:hypothetical protein
MTFFPIIHLLRIGSRAHEDREALRCERLAMVNASLCGDRRTSHFYATLLKSSCAKAEVRNSL